MHSDVATSRFIQLVRTPSRIYNRRELEQITRVQFDKPENNFMTANQLEL